MTRSFLVIALAFSVSCLSSLQVKADTAIAVQSYSLDDPAAGFETMGYEFLVHNDIQVTALGCWDYFDNGLNADYDVGLWTNTGSLLGSLTIPSGTTAELDNSYRYVDLPSPILLSAGSYYRIGGFVVGDYYPRVHASTIVTDPSISLPTDFVYRHVGSSLAFPSQGIFGTPYGYIAGNFKFTVVPEPSASLLLCIFSINLMVYVWGRRRS